MRICFLADAQSPHTRRWVHYFAHRGYQVSLLSYHPIPEDLVFEGVAGYSLNDGTAKAPGIEKDGENAVANGPGLGRRAFRGAWNRLPGGLSFFITLERYARRARAIIRRIQPDIVHGHFLTNHGYIAARSGFSPLVVSAWGSDVLVKPNHSSFFLRILGYTLRKADLITSDAAFLSQRMIDYGAAREKIITFPWGIDPDIFHPGETTPSPAIPFTVFCSRSLEPIYNVELVVRAIPHVAEHIPQVRVFLKGNGSLRENLEKLVDELHIRSYVNFLDWMTPEELARHYRCSQVYVSAARSDGTSVSLLEAMACGAFPIVSDLPGNREWIREGENGLLFTGQDPIELAHRIIEAFRREDLRAAARRKNLNLVQQRAIWSKNLEELEDRYRSLYKRGAGKRHPL